MSAIPVFFEVDAIGKDGALEANGRVHYYAPGQDADYLPGTQCETCGSEVVANG